MSRDRSADARLARLRARVGALVTAVIDGDGVTSSRDRRAARAGLADDPAVEHYLDVVRRHAYRVTDGDIAALRLEDDAIFELTVAAALGAAEERLAAGLSVLGRAP